MPLRVAKPSYTVAKSQIPKQFNTASNIYTKTIANIYARETFAQSAGSALRLSSQPARPQTQGQSPPNVGPRHILEAATATSSKKLSKSETTKFRPVLFSLFSYRQTQQVLWHRCSMAPCSNPDHVSWFIKLHRSPCFSPASSRP